MDDLPESIRDTTSESIVSATTLLPWSIRCPETCPINLGKPGWVLQYILYIFARNGNANEPIKYIQLCNLLRSFPYFPINFLKPFQGFHGCFERVFWSFLLQGWLLSPSRPQRLSSPSLSNGAPLFRHLGGGSGTHRRLSCFHFWAPGYPKMMENYGKLWKIILCKNHVFHRAL